jgi:F0F1-type ATP synthase delta subunit
MCKVLIALRATRPPQSENDLLGSSYANALVDLASDKNNLEEVHADMDALASILKVLPPMHTPTQSSAD